MNKLPEKLTLLRKYKNLSQGDLAKKINVPVTEYMQWENGNRICTIQQLKMLADIFGVSLDALADNTKEIVIPESELDESVMIPFNMGQDINATQAVDSSLENTVQTAQLNTLDEADDEDNGHTRVVSASQLAKAQEEADAYEEEEEEEKSKKKKSAKKTDPKKKKKQSIIIIVSVCALVVVIALILLLLRGSASSLSVGNDNRIAVGNTYSLYVDNKGSIKKYGDFSSTESFSSAVQVSAFDSHAAILKSNGTVVSSDGNSEVAEWSDIKYIAAGANHTVGVTNEGKVVCAGSEDACKVSDWSNISSVYAGNEFTIALTNDGEVKTSGNNTTAVSNQSNVAHVGISDNLIVLTKKDGTVSVYPIGSAESLDTSSWTDIQSTAVGTNLIAGLSKDGTVKLAYSDEEMVTKVSSWKNIKYISACGSTLVGINASGNMVGAGDNSYNQYVDTSDSDDTDDAGELDEPKNIQISTTTANVVIKWDTVENADYYEVSIDTDPVTETKTSSNSTSVAASTLEDGKEYVVTVTAKSNDEDKYKESSATQTFTYTAKTVQLSTPSDITASSTDSGWKIEWPSVEHADHYVVSLNGESEFTVDTNSYTFQAGVEPGNTYTISVKATSDDSTYTDSETAQKSLQYAMQSQRVTVIYVYEDGTQTGNSAVVDVYIGTEYDSKTLAQMAGYSDLDSVVSERIKILSGKIQYNITVTKQE